MIEIKKTEDGWYADFNKELAEHILNSIKITVQNANDLLDEANILFDNSRFARAAALAILSEEEFAKSILMKECVQAKAWNSFYYNILKQHPEKQAISEYISFILSKIKEVIEQNQFRTIPLPIVSTIFPESVEIQEFREDLQKNTIKKKKRDIYKQSMFYVNIGKTAILTKSPREVSLKEAAICLDQADKLKEITRFIHEDLPVNNLDKRFRQITTITTDYTTYWTICHEEGFNLSLDLFKFTYISQEEAYKEIEKFLRATRIIGKFLEDKKKAKPTKEFKRCLEFSTKHNLLDQIQSQKKELGLRYSLLEEVIKISLGGKG